MFPSWGNIFQNQTGDCCITITLLPLNISCLLVRVQLKTVVEMAISYWGDHTLVRWGEESSYTFLVMFMLPYLYLFIIYYVFGGVSGVLDWWIWNLHDVWFQIIFDACLSHSAICSTVLFSKMKWTRSSRLQTKQPKLGFTTKLFHQFAARGLEKERINNES